jgi:hypothetical protein
MPVLPRILGLLAMMASFSLAVWLGHYSRWSDTVASERTMQSFRDPRPRIVRDRPHYESETCPAPGSDSSRPPIASKPPYPKVLIEEQLYNFGIAPPGETKSHGFCITNIGEAPLLLVKPPTGWSKGWRRTLRVGERFEYELFWNPSYSQTCFAQGVVLFTNDPQRPQIEMAVFGRVGYPCPVTVGNGVGILP